MEEDREVLIKALSSFALYAPSLHSANQLRRTDYISLKQAHKDLLPGYLAHLEEIDDAIALNAKVVELMLHHGAEALLEEPWRKEMGMAPSHGDLEKIRATVKQIVRDWSKEGSIERELTYDPLLKLLEGEYAQIDKQDRSKISVLTPGCGLGRLSYEIARLGFDSVGNEFSYHMLIASHYFLNCTTAAEQHEIAPYTHSASNHKTREDMLRRVKVPDVVPSDALRNAAFSMATGEFIESFGGSDSASTFDCVVTCFFLDTAHNIVAYIETIRNVLKADGLWINLGPCLWHHEHGQNRHGKSAFDEEGNFVGSIELTMQEVIDLVSRMGFRIEQTNSVKTGYMGNDRSMLQHVYDASVFTARAPQQ